MHAGRPAVLAELGQTAQALAEAGPVADRIEASGDIAYVEPRALQLRLLAERGTPTGGPAPDEFVTAVRDIGLATVVAPAFAAAAQLLLAQRRPDEAKALLHELDQLPSGARHSARELPSVLRVCARSRRRAARRAAHRRHDRGTPLSEHALASTRAQLAEAAGEHAAAAQLYREAAERWLQFGNVPERAYALLGEGRCLTALQMPEAAGPLRRAAELFASIGYRPALVEPRRCSARVKPPPSNDVDASRTQ